MSGALRRDRMGGTSQPTGPAVSPRVHAWMARWVGPLGPTRVGAVFGRKKDEQDLIPAQQQPVPQAEDARPGAKNRRTPTRREAQAARQRPLVPSDRKAAAAESRVRERQQRTKMRAAMYAGEEWALPPRDRGPQRAFIRDVLDARWNLAEFLLPIMLIGLPVSLIPNRTAVIVGYLIVYGAVLLALLDGFFMWRTVRKRVQAKFGTAPDKGSVWYSISRSMQIRPGRVPRPRVRRGQHPS